MKTRPVTLKDFIGQKKVAEQINVAIKASKYKDKAFPHCVMGGPPGLGKTTIASIISSEMNGKLVSRIATAMKKPEDLIELFEEVNQLNTIIFIDEVEQLDRKLTEMLHTAMEDFKLTIKTPEGTVETDLPEFTLIAATNYLGELPRPFLDRFRVQVNFETYSESELKEIITRFVDRNEDYLVDEEASSEIAKRSRGVPRIALRLLDQVRDTIIAHEEMWTKKEPETERLPRMTRENAIDSFKLMNIDQNGLIDLDFKILSHLVKNGESKVGLSALAQAINEDVSTVNLSESFLIQRGLVIRTSSGRMITKEGQELLSKTENKNKEQEIFSS